MPQIINVKSEIIRINPDNNTIEYSQNGGRSWILRHSNSFCGIFYDLFLHGSEILACTSKGLYYSSNEGRSWIIRYSGTYAAHSNNSVLMGKIYWLSQVKVFSIPPTLEDLGS
jgi:hypothetical protein